MASFDHVVWDWNGTLLDDTALCVGIMNRMLGRRGLPPVSPAFYRAVIEFPVENYYRKLGFDFAREPFETISDEFVSLYQAGWRGCALQSGSRETLAALNAAGVGQSVLSASLSRHLREQLCHFGVEGLISSASGASDHHGKGKRHIARGHAESTGADAARMLFVGDTAHDAEAAAEAGCACLLVSFGHYGEQRLNALGLPVAGSMEDVLNYIMVRSM